MDKIESNDPLPAKWFRLKRGRLQGAKDQQFLLTTERTDGIHTLAYLKREREQA